MISVIMGVYNQDKYVAEAIESILEQSFREFEFIIINDCSTDRSGDIIQDYAARDRRIKVIENRVNQGLTYSLNRGLEAAGGKYIARMDADDISKKERLERQYDFLEKHPEVAVLGTAALDIDGEGRITGRREVPLTFAEIKKSLPLVNPLTHSSVMFRKEEVGLLGNYNEAFPKVQDYELWFRVIEKGYEIMNLDEELLLYRVNDHYLERKSLGYRLTDLKIRWQGYRRLGLPVYSWYGLLIPIFLGLTPDWMLNLSYRFLKRFDPRRR